MHYAIVFLPNGPVEIRQLFGSYLEQPPGTEFQVAFSKIADIDGPFLSCELEHKDRSTTMRVRIPIPFVFSIIEYPDDKRPIGFLATEK